MKRRDFWGVDPREINANIRDKNQKQTLLCKTMKVKKAGMLRTPYILLPVTMTNMYVIQMTQNFRSNKYRETFQYT